MLLQLLWASYLPIYNATNASVYETIDHNGIFSNL